MLQYIGASVGVNGVNRAADVLVIQNLLNAVPASSGGPQIPLVKDGRFGPKTAAAISRFQLRWLGWADCLIQPGHQTIAKLNELAGGGPPAIDFTKEAICTFPPTPATRHLILSFALGGGAGLFASAGAAVAPAPAKPTDQAKTDRVLAMGWVSNAVLWLSKAMQVAAGKLSDPASQAIFNAVDVHFHTTEKAAGALQIAFLALIIQNYMQIIMLMGGADQYFGDDFNTYPAGSSLATAYAHAPIGGWSDPARAQKVWFRPSYATIPGVKCRTAILIHECAHSVASALHFAYGHPRPNGIAGVPFNKPDGSPGPTHPRDYAHLLPDEAAKNADTYATFAAHASTLDPSTAGDIRPGAHNVNT